MITLKTVLIIIAIATLLSLIGCSIHIYYNFNKWRCANFTEISNGVWRRMSHTLPANTFDYNRYDNDMLWDWFLRLHSTK